jgi:polysaccharide lyase-like protein
MLYRVVDNVLVTGLMFSTFFGGHDPSWASPRMQSAFFRN